MTEYQIFNIMHLGFVQNAMYFVGMTLFIWLGFRMANNIYNNSEANLAAKVFTSLYCLLVALMMFNVQQIGAAILGTAVMQLGEIGAEQLLGNGDMLMSKNGGNLIRYQSAFISDNEVNNLIKDIISDPKKKNKLIFDGYPRSISQAKNLDSILKNSNQKIDFIFFLNVKKEIIIKRTHCIQMLL